MQHRMYDSGVRGGERDAWRGAGAAATSSRFPTPDVRSASGFEDAHPHEFQSTSTTKKYHWSCVEGKVCTEGSKGARGSEAGEA